MYGGVGVFVIRLIVKFKKCFLVFFIINIRVFILKNGFGYKMV